MMMVAIKVDALGGVGGRRRVGGCCSISKEIQRDCG